jgi:hypothetical protein
MAYQDMMENDTSIQGVNQKSYLLRLIWDIISLMPTCVAYLIIMTDNWPNSLFVESRLPELFVKDYKFTTVASARMKT